MINSGQTTLSASSVQDEPDQPLHRSGAVAHMLGMPVATLRVWERRYHLTQAALSPGRQRLYSAADVQRLALLRQLTENGHAIGSLAHLDMAGLLRVATFPAALRADPAPAAEPATNPTASVRAWRIAVVGAALAARLRQPRLQRRLGKAVVVLGPYANLAQAAAALPDGPPDALLFHEPQLQAGWLAAIAAEAPTWTGLPRAVLYRFASDAVCEALATAGMALLREPQPDAVLAQWLCSLSQTAPAPLAHTGPTSAPPESVPPRRWDDAVLSEFANLSSTVACECPRHVAELVLQLSHFEAYSAACADRNPGDAELHAYLNRVATVSRAQFEAALAAVARHEGLALPAPTV